MSPVESSEPRNFPKKSHPFIFLGRVIYKTETRTYVRANRLSITHLPAVPGTNTADLVSDLRFPIIRDIERDTGETSTTLETIIDRIAI